MKLQIALSYQEVRGDYSVVETTRQERLVALLPETSSCP